MKKIEKSKNQSFRNNASKHEYRQISNIFNRSFYKDRDHDLFIIIICALLSIFRIHRIIRNVRNKCRICIDKSFE